MIVKIEANSNIRYMLVMQDVYSWPRSGPICFVIASGEFYSCTYCLGLYRSQGARLNRFNRRIWHTENMDT